MRKAIILVTMVSSACVSNRRLYELDTGDVVECEREQITGCGVVLRDCDGEIDYLCEFAVRAIDYETE
jgi:hypothetical protein